MRAKSFYLAIGIAIGSAISNSATAIFIGAGIAIAPWLLVGLAHVWGWSQGKLWGELDAWQRKARRRIFVEPMTSSEYEKFYNYGELPERFERYERRDNRWK